MSILPDSGRGDVFALPDRMPGKLRHVRHSCTVFGGLAGAGEVGADTLQAMANLVPCGYPALTTGNARLQYLAAPTTGAAHGLTLHRGKVVLAQGTGLFVSSDAGACTRLGNVTDTDKRFASFGDLLFILPDGLVYNAADGSLREFGLDTGNMENVSIDNVYLTVPTAGLQTKGFRVGDCIRLDIQGDIKSAVLNGYYRISALTESYLCVEGGFPERGTFTARVRRVMPDLEGLCAMGDRLYGFAGQSVYACEAGNPWNWYWADAASPETAPFSLHTAGGNDFTACTVWQGYPIFFRADGISRLMGRAHVAGGFLAATGVTLSEQSAPGIPAGQAATLCGLDGALYYCSGSDVYRYAGAAPARVCDGLPAGLRGICAGTDGRGLYLSATESNGTRRLFLYCPGLGWYRLDPVSVTAALFCPDGTGAGQGDFCLLQRLDGYLFLTRSSGTAATSGFMAATVPTPEATAEFGDETALLPDGGRLLAVHLRACGRIGSSLKLYVRYDGESSWQLLGSVAGSGREELIRIPVPPRPCRWFRFRLSFSGSGAPGRPDGAFRVSGMWWDTEQGGA